MSDSTTSTPSEPEGPVAAAAQPTETTPSSAVPAEPTSASSEPGSSEPANSEPGPGTPPPAPTEPPMPPAPPAGPPTAQTLPPIPPVPPSAEHGHPAAPQKRSGNIGVIAALAIGALIGGVSGAGVTAISLNNAEQPAAQGPSSTNITVNDPGNATTVTAVAAAAAASVVTISASGEGASGTGSGVFLDKEGHVLTNAHVATLSGATSDPTITVQTSDGHLYKATLVGTDPIADLAVVKVDAPGVEFQPAKFADSAKLNVGDTVVALGAPLGLSNTVTSGIVSALNRSITVASSAVPEGGADQVAPDEGNGNNGPFDFWEFDNRSAPKATGPRATISLPVIQTDAAINPGNSGGALLDSDGRVIGINVAIASAGAAQGEAGNIGVGFAIPSNLAKRVASELIENGTASHGLLGANVLSVTDDPDAAGSAVVGAVIKDVVRGGAADAAGLRAGDIVTGFNGMPITSSIDLTAQVRVLAGGSDAEVVYLRNGKTATVTVTLGELEL